MKRFGGDRSDTARVPGRLARSRRFAPTYALRLLAHPTGLGADGVRATGFSGVRARDFEDFVSGEDRGVAAGLLPLPDPSFRESLRRRLWRIQLLSRRHRGTTTH